MAERAGAQVAALLKDCDVDECQASLQGSNPRLGYPFVAEKNATAYADRQGYEGYALQFSDETKGIVELEAIDKWAAELASMLYTYRSIARALPVVTGDEDHKRAMYAASFEVLHPAISRVKQLISFKVSACDKWTTNLALLVRAENKQRSKSDAPLPCEALYVQLMSTLDMLAVLDALKDTKACLNNDFSQYKRAFHHCRSSVPDAEQVRQPSHVA
jgi:cytoplasmic FMR1 interacting protein